MAIFDVLVHDSFDHVLSYKSQVRWLAGLDLLSITLEWIILSPLLANEYGASNETQLKESFTQFNTPTPPLL